VLHIWQLLDFLKSSSSTSVITIGTSFEIWFSYIKVKFYIKDKRKFIPEFNLVSKKNLSKLLSCAHYI